MIKRSCCAAQNQNISIAPWWWAEVLVTGHLCPVSQRAVAAVLPPDIAI